MLQKTCFPPGGMTASNLRLELTLVKAKTGVVAAGAIPKYTTSEEELVLEYMDLASDAARMVSQSKLGGYMISFYSFVIFSSSLETGAGGANVLFLVRYSSLNISFPVIRETSEIATHTAASMSGRSNLFNDTGQWYY